MTSDARITWFPNRDPIRATCPLCDATGEVVVVASTPDLQTRRPVDYARCASCASVWPLEVTPFPYPSDDELFDDERVRVTLHHALELVSVLPRQAALLESLAPESGCRLLEVGCNVGILAAYASEMLDAHVEGVEPSVFGEMARAAFGIEVHRQPLTPALSTDAEQFDVIISIEVLEHVDDPMVFLTDIRRRLADGGVALITTPAAESLDGALDEGVALGVLSVGGHNFLYSRARLEADLAAAGFDHVHVTRDGPDLIARLGRPSFDDVDPAWIDERVRAFRDRRRPTDTTLPRAELGLAIDRYLAQRAHDAGAGREVEAEVERGLIDVFDVDAHELAPTVATVLGTTDLQEYGLSVPFRLGEFLYWRGQRDDLSEYERTSMWEASLLVIDHGLRTDPQNLGPLLPALGPTAVALANRRPGRFRDELRSAKVASPHDLVRDLPEPAGWSEAVAAARSRVGRVLARLRR